MISATTFLYNWTLLGCKFLGPVGWAACASSSATRARLAASCACNCLRLLNRLVKALQANDNNTNSNSNSSSSSSNSNNSNSNNNSRKNAEYNAQSPVSASRVISSMSLLPLGCSSPNQRTKQLNYSWFFLRLFRFFHFPQDTSSISSFLDKPKKNKDPAHPHTPPHHPH